MKFLVSLVLTLAFTLPSFAAPCDFSKGIKENNDGSYTYTRDCHIEVGKAVKSVSLLEERIVVLEKKIEIKDLIITKYEERTQLWMDTSIELNEKLQSYDRLSSFDNSLFFGLGMGLAFASVWAAGQIK